MSTADVGPIPVNDEIITDVEPTEEAGQTDEIITDEVGPIPGA